MDPVTLTGREATQHDGWRLGFGRLLYLRTSAHLMGGSRRPRSGVSR